MGLKEVGAGGELAVERKTVAQREIRADADLGGEVIAGFEVAGGAHRVVFGGVEDLTDAKVHLQAGEGIEARAFAFQEGEGGACAEAEVLAGGLGAVDEVAAHERVGGAQAHGPAAAQRQVGKKAEGQRRLKGFVGIRAEACAVIDRSAEAGLRVAEGEVVPLEGIKILAHDTVVAGEKAAAEAEGERVFRFVAFGQVDLGENFGDEGVFFRDRLDLGDGAAVRGFLIEGRCELVFRLRGRRGQRAPGRLTLVVVHPCAR